MAIRYNTKTFISKLKEIYGDKYDYSKVQFINRNEKVTLKCDIHGEFEKTAHSLLYCNCACSKCATGILTNELFIKKSIERYGDKYDYSEVNYISNTDKVKIKCNEHGIFEITPKNYLKGIECKNCINKNIGKKFTTKEFIKRAILIHQNQYDYSKTNYVNSNLKVIVTCKIHGDFEIVPNKHLRGTTCALCSYKFNYTNDIFIKKAKEIHGDKNDYSLVNYVGSTEKVIIICKEHGEFEQVPSSHLGGAGCKTCSFINIKNNQLRNNDSFIEKANKVHNNYYNYSKVEYKGCFENVIITCPLHGNFEQKPAKHLYGQGCTECNRKRRNDKFTMSQNDFIKKAVEIHGNKYDYSKAEYVNYGTPMIIICKIHGEFKQDARSHLGNKGCPCCYNKTEGQVYNELKKYYPNIVFQFRTNWCKKERILPFDLALLNKKIIIEVDGGQHFRQVQNWRTPEEQQELDLFKMQCALKKGYSIIRILQEEIYKKKFDWKKELLEAIEDCVENKNPSVTFICKKNEYSVYDDLI